MHSPATDAEFAWKMEDVLGVYTRPYDPARGLLGRDQPPAAGQGAAAAAGGSARYDSEYVRGRVANLFLVCEPLRGWRQVQVSDRWRREDWPHCVKVLVDVHYPDAGRIVLLMD